MNKQLGKKILLVAAAVMAMIFSAVSKCRMKATGV